MDEEQPTGFKIGLEQTETDAEPEAEDRTQAGSKPAPASNDKPGKEKKPKKQRDSLLMVTCLGFLVLILVIGYIYYDIQDRIQTINTSGSEEVARLSSELSNNMVTMENQLTAIKKASQKQMAGIRSDLEQGQDRIDEFQTRMAALEKNIDNLQQTLEPLEEQGQQLSEKIAAIEQTSQSIKKTQSAIESQLDEHSEEIETLSQELHSIPEKQVTPEMMEEAIKAERQSYKENIAHTTETLLSEIATVKENLQGLAENLENLEKQTEKANANAASENGNSRSEQPETMQIPAEGGIIEQEIEQ